MERGCNGGGGGGVKVTFIETQFVTSDAAGFKSLVQRLTGNDATAAAHPPPLQRPRPCRAAADGWRGGAGGATTVVAAAQREAVPPSPWVDEMLLLYETCDLDEMLVGASGGRCHGGGGYGGFPC
ncbi:uncharacterized protein LOC102699752 [Oryza brachyantha]|uniref:uncharacterized protein LOC102699752 n=1 Tax=Oryza brachyantha TaxID=4533 RepID=UPI001ADD2499|nr:uncharacterized protein LOC102699752 [Oryza brachyantha]